MRLNQKTNKIKKTITTLVLAIITGALVLASTPDSMYVHFTGANGDSIVAHAVANVDSIVYYAPAVPQGIDWSSVAEGVIQANALTDADGKSYSAVKIGTQVWMSENLAYLLEVHSNSEFVDFTGATTASDSIRYGVYVYNGTDVTAAKAEANYSTYGVLYNWYAAMAGASSSDANPSAVQGVCPTGWHLPSDAEWKTLEMELGMTQDDADKAGFRGTNKGSQLAGNSDLWDSGNLEENSEFGTSGFLALPDGFRDYSNGTFRNQRSNGGWWISTQGNSSYAFYRYLNYDFNTIYRGYGNKPFGFSVRCLRD